MDNLMVGVLQVVPPPVVTVLLLVVDMVEMKEPTITMDN